MGEPATVAARDLLIGDVVTVPGVLSAPCRIEDIRSAAPGLVSLHLQDLDTDRLLPYGITLTADQQVAVHGHAAN